MEGSRLRKTPRRGGWGGGGVGGSEGAQSLLITAFHIHKLAHRSL